MAYHALTPAFPILLHEVQDVAEGSRISVLACIASIDSASGVATLQVPGCSVQANLDSTCINFTKVIPLSWYILACGVLVSTPRLAVLCRVSRSNFAG
jgi:hypothetical protein